MSLRIRGLGVALFVTVAAALVAADPPTPAELVKRLGDRDFRAREEASKALWQLGDAARPALEEGLKSNSPEVASRCKKLLDKFNRGIFPDTPKELLALIDRFIAGDEDGRFDAARKLIDFGPKGVDALARQLRKGFGSEEERYDFHSQLQRHLRGTVPVLLFDGKEAEAEALLRLHSYAKIWLKRPGENEFRGAADAAVTGPLDYAAFMARRGKGKELVERMLEARALPGDVGREAGSGLLCAYRVAGERAKLTALLTELTKGNAELAGLREGVLMDADDWATLAEEKPADANSQDGLTAFRLRMAGKEKEATALLDEVKASDHATAGGYAMEDGALALLLNGRTEDGIARLKATGTAPHVLTDMLAVRLDFKAAMDAITAGLAGRKRNPDDDEDTDQLANLYLAKKGRILAQLGQRDAAAQVFGGMAEKLTFGYNHGPALLNLVKAEVRSGFPDLAAELLGKAQGMYDAGSAQPPSYNGQDPYEILFEGDAEAAFFWWQVLRETRAKTDPAKRMATVRRLLAGKLTTDEVKGLLAEAAKAKFTGPAGRNPDGGNRVTPHRKAVGMATAQRIAGDHAAAAATLTEYANWRTNPKSPQPATEEPPGFDEDFDRRRPPGGRQWVFGIDESFRLWLDLGDLLVAQKKPKEAADALLGGWRLDPNNGILLFYSGKALLAAGDEKEGRRRMALAHDVSLGNARFQGRLLEELVNRGEASGDIRAGRDTARQTAWLTEGNNGNVWNQIARAGAVLKDFGAAAAANRRAIHYVLRRQGVTYVEGYAYVNVLATVRGYEARHLLAKGKHAAAIATANDALDQLPTHTDLVIGMVLGLEKAGRKADADALFARAWEAFAKVIREHPDSAWARHTAAWMAAGCRRELDAALAHSKKAVEMEPDSKAHRSGLAEVSFRKGDRAKAVELMAKLVTEDRRNHFYQRQLDRYKTAAFDSPLPDNDDD